MNIQHEQFDGEGAFFIEENEERVAEMTYAMQDDSTMVIDHTQVDEALQGQHIGNFLVERGVEYARSKNLKIIPTCKFAAAVFKREKQYEDVLK